MYIIQTTTSLSPEFGGPARSVPALSKELARLGNQVTILSLDFGYSDEGMDLPSDPNLNYVSVEVKLRVGMRPLWTPAYRGKLSDIAAGGRDVIIHDNGIWLPYSGIIHQIARKWDIPVITSVRGMLEPWSLSYRRLRKKVAWNLYQRRRLESNAVLHATSREEAGNLRGLGLRMPVALLPNGTVFPDLSSVVDLDPQDKRTLLFISRINPKKGLLSLIRVIGELQPTGWQVVLAGYDEGGYWDTIRREIEKAGVENYFTYIGPVTDKEKWAWYKMADLFILPSYSENFGLVIAESLAAGTPVITTRGTPWKDLVDYNCGWWVEPEVEDLTEALREAISLDVSDLDQMGNNGRALIREKYSWPAIAAKLNQVYEWVLHNGSRPPEIIL